MRTHLLQSGADERTRHFPDRLRHGKLHCGRGVCSGHVGRDRDCAQSGNDLPCRPSAGESRDRRSEEHTSELQSLMRISYAVFCLKKKKTDKQIYKMTERAKLTTP